MKTDEKIYTQHAEHTDWISKLKFYDDEICILKNRLSEIISKNTQKDILAQAEHFQNQFIIQKNNIDEISHTITVDEDAIQKIADKNHKTDDHRKKDGHNKEKESVDSFEETFHELRNEFNKFAAKLM